MAIIQPSELKYDNKKFCVILYGSAGVGKTTLALSAPKPLLIDCDKGIARVKAMYRTPSIQSKTYEEILKDIQSPEIKDFETIVIDTGGSFVTYLQDWAMRSNPQNVQKNGGISQKGFGAVKSEFLRFSNYIMTTLNKHLIYIFHADEQKDKDGNPIQRLICEGSSKNIVWQPCDFGGYVQMIDNQRTIGFTPTQEHFGKCSYGIDGVYKIPSLDHGEPNDFLTKLFEVAHKTLEEESKAEEPDKKQYEAVMRTTKDYLDHVTTVKELNTVKDAVANMKHALTSKKECGAMLNNKAKELGCVLDKATKQYVQKA